MNRAELQQLAEERVRDADALLKAGQWSGAYYLSGYAVECGLKACIAKLTSMFDFPDKDRAQRCFTHNVDSLIRIAGLELQRKIEVNWNAAFARNWLLIKDWDEQARYQLWTESQARKLFAAVADTTNGVLQWIKGRW